MVKEGKMCLYAEVISLQVIFHHGVNFLKLQFFRNSFLCKVPVRVQIKFRLLFIDLKCSLMESSWIMDYSFSIQFMWSSKDSQYSALAWLLEGTIIYFSTVEVIKLAGIFSGINTSPMSHQNSQTKTFGWVKLSKSSSCTTCTLEDFSLWGTRVWNCPGYWINRR